MTSNQLQRKSPRWKDYDYSRAGIYFVTIVTHKRLHLFGQVSDADVVLSPIGQIAYDCWKTIPQHYPYTDLDLFVVMPNHIHGLLVITDDDLPKTKTLGSIIGGYKATVTRLSRQLPNVESDWIIWQSRFHDHIVRNVDDLQRLREYIIHNPMRWSADTLFIT